MEFGSDEQITESCKYWIVLFRPKRLFLFFFILGDNVSPKLRLFIQREYQRDDSWSE